MTKRKVLVFLAGALSASGLALSSYLTDLTLKTSSACNLNSFLSCTPVISSPYSKVAGIPTAVLGITWFSISLLLGAISYFKTPLMPVFAGWGVIGLAGAIILIYIEIYLVGAICLLCTTTHALAGIIFVTTILNMRLNRATSGRKDG